MKILTVVGARPQFVKAATVSRALASAGLPEVLVHTGQHHDEGMSDVFFAELAIPAPKHHLGIHGGHHGAQTGRMLEALEQVMIAEKPSWVLVYGDTNSTLAGALAAVKLHLPIAHVEAGLRSFNRAMPEEVNRVLTDHAADLLLAPTALAMTNLAKEGLQGQLVGDVMYDAALHYARADRPLPAGLAPGTYALATVHRASNTDDPTLLRTIIEALQALARDLPVVFPVHPRTRQALERHAIPTTGLVLSDPVGYLDMVALERHARLIATDSGGVQKEAFFFHVPCVTLREETEWVELVELGWNRLAPPTDAAAVAAAFRAALDARPTPGASPYGEGRAAEAVVAALQAR